MGMQEWNSRQISPSRVTLHMLEFELPSHAVADQLYLPTYTIAH